MKGHYIPANEQCRLPGTWIVVDTEAHAEPAGAGHTQQTFRLACSWRGTTAQLLAGGGGRPIVTHHDPGSLWDEITGWSKHDGRAVLMAHNLAYDLRIGDGIRQLDRRGWECKTLALDHGHAWGRWQRKGTSLYAVDSLSWTPVALAELAKDVGLAKVDLPGWDDRDEAWEERCRRDVEILRAVWGRIVAWLAGERLGNWRPTGAGQAWAAWRHTFQTTPVLVHPDVELKEVERRAAWAGRAEAWRHGRLPKSTYTEWDWTAAYASICRDEDLPAVYAGESSTLSLRQLTGRLDRFRILLDCEVSTAVPVVPTRTDRGVIWPVGTFSTTLWDPEWSLVLDTGGEVRPHRAWLYRAEPALQAWAEWVLDVLDAPAGEVDPIVRRVVKHWSRALIGKFGTQWRPWEPFGAAAEDDVCLWTGFDADTAERFRMLQIGRELRREGRPRLAQDSAPQIVSFVTSAARRRLWSTMVQAGLDHVVYVDTDSVVTDPAGSSNLEEAGWPGLRRKREWSRLEVLGPRQLVQDGRLAAAGVPRGAIALGRGRWEGEVWSTLPGSLASGAADRVAVRRRVWRMAGVDRRRVHVAKHLTAPVVLSE